jgi:hypothetical protein
VKNTTLLLTFQIASRLSCHLDILPRGSNGIIVVFENICNQTFSYQMIGLDVSYLGPIDAHDSKYDYLEESSSLVDLKDFNSGKIRAYTGLPLTEDVCPYTLRLYPSQVMVRLIVPQAQHASLAYGCLYLHVS